jgi:hypothetical protein
MQNYSTTICKRTEKYISMYVARMGEKRNTYRSLMGKSDGKRPLGRLRCMCENNIEIDVEVIGWHGTDWI